MVKSQLQWVTLPPPHRTETCETPTIMTLRFLLRLFLHFAPFSPIINHCVMDSPPPEGGDGRIETALMIIVHYRDDFFMLEEDDVNYDRFIDLRSTIHTILRIDCKVKTQFEGERPDKSRVVVEDDQSMVSWFIENSSEKIVHLYVEVIRSHLEPFSEDPTVGEVSEKLDFDDESYNMSDEIYSEDSDSVDEEWVGNLTMLMLMG